MPQQFLQLSWQHKRPKSFALQVTWQVTNQIFYLSFAVPTCTLYKAKNTF